MNFKAVVLSAILAIGIAAPSFARGPGGGAGNTGNTGTTGHSGRGPNGPVTTGPGFGAANQAATAQAWICGETTDVTSELVTGLHGLSWNGSLVARPDADAGFVVQAHNIGTASWTSTSTDTTPDLVALIALPDGSSTFQFLAPSPAKTFDRWNFIASALLYQFPSGSRVVGLTFFDDGSTEASSVTASNIIVNNRTPSVVRSVDTSCEFAP